MAEFVYNNSKNVNRSHLPFEINCGFKPKVSYKYDVDSCSKSKAEDELGTELSEMTTILKKNLQKT